MLVNACRPRHMHLHIFYVRVLVFVCACVFFFPIYSIACFPFSSPHFYPLALCLVFWILSGFSVLLGGVGSPEITSEKQQQTVG